LAFANLPSSFCGAETTGDLLQVAEGDVNETTGFIESALQHDGMPVGVPPQKLGE